MAEPKTKMTEASVTKFIEAIDDEQKRDDCFEIIKMMKKAAGAEAKMWGTAIIGFGTRPQVYASGKTLDWPVIAFSPRKQNITLYISQALLKKGNPVLEKLGKFKTSKACLYINSLRDVDTKVLQKIFDASVKS